mgnify:CR=1 FL=1
MTTALKLRLATTVPVSTLATAARYDPVVDFSQRACRHPVCSVRLVEHEAAQFQRGTLPPRPHSWADLPEEERKLTRRASNDPDSALDALAPFIRGALGGAPAATHDAAARCLCALVEGTTAKPQRDLKELVRK